MSFIRKKLSKIWDRSSDESSRSSQEHQRTSISSENEGYSSNTIPSLLESISESSPGRLHKAASTTFQAFSDTIRAKTLMFYARSSGPQSAGLDAPELKTPQKHGQRSLIWSSARSRQGLSDRTNRIGTANDLGTPTASRLCPAEPAPALDVNIPTPSLTDLRDRDEFAADVSPIASEKEVSWKEYYTPKQLWPSPTPMTSSETAELSGLISHAARPSLTDDPYAESPYGVLHDSAMFKSCREDHDAGYSSDIESIADRTKTDGFSPASMKSLSYYTPPTTTVPRSPQSRHSLFVKGGQARVHFIQTPSPFRKAKQSQGFPLANAVTEGSRPNSSLEPPATVVHPDLSMPNFSEEPIGTTGRLVPSDSPIAHLSTSSDRSSGGYCLDLDAIGTAENGGYSRLPSHVYEADAESVASSPSTPHMGSRNSWIEARADRNDRYLAIHTMSETTYSDDESDSELELSRSGLGKPVHLSEEDEGVSLSGGDHDARRGITEYSDAEIRTLESRSPSYASLQKKLEALELLQSSCEAFTDSESQVSIPPDPGLRFYVEANNKASGTVLDESETPHSASMQELLPDSESKGYVKSVMGGSFAGLASYVSDYPHRSQCPTPTIEQISSAKQEALPPPVSASSSDGGRQSYENIQGVTNTKMDDEEFQDVVQRTNDLDRLLLRHNLRLHKRINDRRTRWQMLKARREDDLVNSSEKDKVVQRNPPNTPVENFRSASSESLRTTDSCAVTTSSPLCYAPPPFPTVHVRASPARRTSSINAGLESQHDQGDGVLSPHLLSDGRASTPEILESIVRKRLRLENASSASEPDSTNASPASAASGPSLAAGTKTQSTMKDYPGSPEYLCFFALDTHYASPSPTAPKSAVVGSLNNNRPILKENKCEKPSKGESGEPLQKKVRLDTEPQVLGETTGNQGKKKRRRRRNRRSKKSDASSEPLKSATSPPLGKALGSIVLDINSPTNLRPTKDDYQTSSHEKGIWWARNKEIVGNGGSPLAGKVVERGRKSSEDKENEAVGSEVEDGLGVGCS